VNELSDRLVVTWDMTEPFDGNQDVTFEPTPHRFQAVLHADGRIDLSYEVLTATDGLVGVFPLPGDGTATAEPVRDALRRSMGAALRARLRPDRERPVGSRRHPRSRGRRIRSRRRHPRSGRRVELRWRPAPPQNRIQYPMTQEMKATADVRVVVAAQNAHSWSRIGRLCDSAALSRKKAQSGGTRE
jgi:hypothetical protein